MNRMNVILAPNQCEKLLQVTLPRPSDNSPQQFLYDENNIVLYEVTKYHDHYRSWFIDNLFCKEGHLNMLTRIDPLFVFLPQLMKYANKQYRTIHDICLTFSSEAPDNMSKLDYALSPDIKWDLVCETQEIDDEMYIKFNHERTLNWLLKKHKNTFETLEKELAAEQPSKATLISYATGLISQYLPSSIADQFKAAVDHMKYNLSNPNGTTTVTSKPSSSAKRTAEASRDSMSKLNKQSSTPAAKAAKDIPKGSVLNFFKKGP